MIRPLHDNVVIQRSTAETQKGMIIIPDKAQEKPIEGTVIAVGPGRWSDDGTTRRPCDVQVGNRVMFGKYTGLEIVIDGEKLIVMPESEIVVVIE